MAQEMMIRSSVQTRTWTSDVIGSWSLEGVCSVSICWDLDASHTSAGKAVSCSQVGVVGVVRSGSGMVRVEGAAGLTFGVRGASSVLEK